LGLLEKKLYKTTPTTYLDELKQRLRTEWAKPVTSSLRQPFVSGVVYSSRSVMRITYTFSCNISHMMLSTGFKFGEFGGHG